MFNGYSKSNQDILDTIAARVSAGDYSHRGTPIYPTRDQTQYALEVMIPFLDKMFGR